MHFRPKLPCERGKTFCKCPHGVIWQSTQAVMALPLL